MAASSNVYYNTAGRIDARDNAQIHFGDSHVHNYVEDPGEKKRQLRIRFLQELRTCPYKERKDRNPERAPGTCEWFTSHERFRAWRDQESALLWASADPGCGKSVLSRYLVDDVLSARDDMVTCYFFFKDDFDDQRTPAGALCCILHQLFNQEPQALSDSIITQYEKEGTFLFTSTQMLFRILLDATKYCTKGVVCVLDALDECSDPEPLIDALRILWLKDDGRVVPKLKFLITSRPYQRIRDDFATLSTIHLSGESEEEVNQISREIDIVIEQRIRQLVNMRHLSDVHERSLREALTKTKHRTYLWVYLAFAELKQARLLHKNALMQTINTLPGSVEEAYSKILSKSDNTKQVLKVLQIVVAAVRPLHLREVGVALAMDTERHQKFADLMADVSDEDLLREELRNLCGLFVVVIEGRLYLLHQTAREFLVRNDPAITPTRKWQDCVELGVANATLAQISMHFLCLGPPPAVEHVFVLHARKTWKTVPFLEYAASYWPEHYRIAEGGSLTTEMIAMAQKLCLEDWWLSIPQYMYSVKISKHGMLICGLLGLISMVPTMLQKYGRHHRVGDALVLASGRGHAGFVKYILTNDVMGAADIHRYWPAALRSTNATLPIMKALEEAVSSNRYHVVKSLLQYMHRTKTPLKVRNAFFRDFRSVEILDLFLEYGVCQNRSFALKYFAEYRTIDFVQVLIRHGARINACDKDGITALMSVAKARYFDMVEFLLCQGAQIEARDRDGRTAAMLTAAERPDPGRGRVLAILLSHGAQIEATDHKGRTVLFYAVRACEPLLRPDLIDLSVLKLLLERGAQIEARDKRGRTPLMAAAARGSLSAVQFLLERGAQVAATDRHGNTARYWVGKQLLGYEHCMSSLEEQIRALHELFDKAGLAEHTSSRHRLSPWWYRP